VYLEFFGLKQPPFRITPDTALFYPGANRGAILEALIYAVGNGEGIVKVVGEVGSGKTMLCRMLEQDLPDRVEIVYLANPSLAPENILHVIAFELKLPVSPTTPRLEVMHALQKYLLSRHAENRQVVVFVEEAQGMPVATLEEIRLLSNLETRQNKLLQIVLFGQPELDEKLAQPEIRQLKERITYSFNLPPFKHSDIRDYLNSRLRACGCRAAELFSPAAVQAIATHSEGLVRRINIIADKSLLAAYADSNIQVSKAHVARAVQDSEFTTTGRVRWRRVVATVAGVAVLVAGAALFWWSGRQPPAPTSISADDSAAGATTGAAAVIAPPPSGGQQPGVGEADSARPVVEPPPEPAEPVAAPTEPLVEPETQADLRPLLEDSPREGNAGPPDSGLKLEYRLSEARRGEAAGADSSDAEGFELRGTLSSMARLGVDGGAPLDAAEMTRLRQDIRRIPPEEVPVSAAGTAVPPCDICWSIVYRPLPGGESL
jgi:type II secretory pathway predicted ATPase ExeA